LGNGFREIVEIAPRRERGLAGTLLVAAGGGGAVLLAELPGNLIAAGLLVALVGMLIRLRAEHARPSLRRAVLLPDGSWQLCFGTAPPVPASLRRAWGDSLGPIIALEWVCHDGSRQRAWLRSRALHGAVRRRLRVRLRLS
jgi:hypothetical protein